MENGQDRARAVADYYLELVGRGINPDHVVGLTISYQQNTISSETYERVAKMQIDAQVKVISGPEEPWKQ